MELCYITLLHSQVNIESGASTTAFVFSQLLLTTHETGLSDYSIIATHGFFFRSLSNFIAKFLMNKRNENCNIYTCNLIRQHVCYTSVPMRLVILITIAVLVTLLV